MGDVCIKAGSYCPICRGIIGSDCWHEASQFHAGSAYLNQLLKAKERISALEGRLVANGEIAKPPCFICGYNGAGYFNPGAHPCAARHHAALTRAEEKGNE